MKPVSSSDCIIWSLRAGGLSKWMINMILSCVFLECESHHCQKDARWSWARLSKRSSCHQGIWGCHKGPFTEYALSPTSEHSKWSESSRTMEKIHCLGEEQSPTHWGPCHYHKKRFGILQFSEQCVHQVLPAARGELPSLTDGKTYLEEWATMVWSQVVIIWPLGNVAVMWSM